MAKRISKCPIDHPVGHAVFAYLDDVFNELMKTSYDEDHASKLLDTHKPMVLESIKRNVSAQVTAQMIIDKEAEIAANK